MLHVAYLPISGSYYSRCIFLKGIFDFNVSYRCSYSGTLRLLLARTTTGPQRSRAESRRLLLARDYSWPVTPALASSSSSYLMSYVMYDFSDALHMRSIMHCFLAGCARLPQQFQWLLLQNLEVMIKIGIKSEIKVH